MGFEMEINEKNEKKTQKKQLTLDNTEVIEEKLLELPLDEFENSNGLYTVKRLPSEFKLYPKKEQTSITYKRYTWGETKKINSSDMPLKQFWEFILSGINTDNSMSKLKLTMGDFFYIAFLRRASTVGRSNFTVEMECFHENDDESKCNHKNKFTIKDSNDPKNSDIEFKNMEVGEDAFPVIIEDDNTRLELSPTTLEDCFKLMNKGLFNDSIAQMAVQIRNLKFDDAYKLLLSDNFSQELGDALDEVIDMFYHRLAPIIKPCEKCKKDLPIVLDAGGTLIKPFRKPSNNGGVRISFGGTPS